MKKVKKILLGNKKDHPAQLEPDGQSILLKRIGCALPCLGVCKGVQNRGCRLIVHTCRFKVSLKNDGFSSNFRDFGSHYYNGLILKSGYLSLKSKKSAHP